jgi:glycosyltransferase involved in cell wall biosynthesis
LLRIGIVCSYLDLQGGGARRYLTELIRGLSQYPEVQVFAFRIVQNDAQQYQHTVALPPKHTSIADRGYPRTALPVNSIRSVFLATLAVKLKLDIIHFPEQFPSYLGFHILQSLIARRIRVISTLHDLAPLIVPEAYSIPFAFSSRMLSFTSRFMDSIIAVSSSTRNDLLAHFKVDPKLVSVVPLGVDTDAFRPSDRNKAALFVKREFGLAGPMLLHVGGSHPRKNLVRLVRAFGMAREKGGITHKLVLAGVGASELPELQQDVARFGLRNSVFQTPPVDHEALLMLYNAADGLIYPSLFEGFGLPPLEAMACGTPVVASSNSSLPEVIGDAGILVDPYNTSSIAEAILRVTQDRALAQDLVQRGLERAGLFSWKKTARDTLDVYNHAVAT